MNIFSYDSLSSRFFQTVGNVIFLNFLFLLCSIPVVTIGPALTALHYSCLKIIKGDDSSPGRNFFHSFRQNFRQSLGIWLLFLLAGTVLSINLHFLNQKTDAFARIWRYFTYALSVGVFFQFLYIFPVVAAFENSTGNLMKNAFLLSYMHLPVTILLAFLSYVAVQLTMTDYALAPFYLFCWCFFGFGGAAIFGDVFFYRIFRPYLT